MFNSKSNSNSRQLGLWDDYTADPGPAIKASMGDAAKSCGLSREQVVGKMNELVTRAGITCGGRGQQVTVAILDKWLAPGADGHHIPLRLLPFFCRAVGSNLPLYVYAQFFMSATIISSDDQKLLDWAKSEVRIRSLRKENKKLAGDIGI